MHVDTLRVRVAQIALDLAPRQGAVTVTRAFLRAMVRSHLPELTKSFDIEFASGMLLDALLKQGGWQCDGESLFGSEGTAAPEGGETP